MLTRSPLVISPVSPQKRSQTSSDIETPEPPGPEDEDDDDLAVLSQRPLGSYLRHDRRTANGTRSLRRRPFLIFDKTEAKGYKQLKNNPQVQKTPMARRYRPGDGFSGREAKPNRSNFLTRNGKQTITSPHVGILDLTRAEPRPVKRKQSVRRANISSDNSFAPAPKKKARRPLEPKDPNQQPMSTTIAPVQEKKSSSALGAADKNRTASATQETGAGHTKTSQARHPPTDELAVPHSNMAQQIASDGEVDMIVVRSDEAQDDSFAAPEPHRPLEEGQESCLTHVTDSSPHQLKIRPRSVSPESRVERDVAGRRPQLSGRAFRRANTQ